MSDIGRLWLFHESYGFRVIPPPMDYDSFVKLLLICANGDGRITAPEREWIVGWVDAFGGPASALDLCRSYDGHGDIGTIVEASPGVRMSATAIIYYGIYAAEADGELHPGEVAALKKVAAGLGISPEKVDGLIDLYYEERALRAKRLRHIYPEGIPFQS